MKILWKPWSAKTFQQAKKEGKIVLLDISAVWCHWCHTMDRTSYSNPEVIKLVNKSFIPVKVDTDERPDVNDRYNLGGWPTTAVLSSSGHVITGGTYIPPDKMVLFLEGALEHSKHFQEPEIEIPTPVLAKKLASQTKTILSSIKEAYDSENGGFGIEPKFPQHDILEFICSMLQRKQSAELKRMLSNTLSTMASREIADHYGGGFYRYATRRDWNYPHFEKMLEDNARLAATYFKAYAITRKKAFLETADQALFFLLSVLYDDKGVFYASQDADEEYCKLELKERIKVKSPYIDKTIYTDANAYAIRALLIAAKVLKQEKYLEMACKATDYLLKKHMTSKGMMHSTKSQIMLLKDNAQFLQTLIDVHEHTEEERYAKAATQLAEIIVKRFSDSNGFFDIAEDKNAIGLMKIRRKVLQDNMTTARALLRLKPRAYKNIATKTLQYFSPTLDSYGPHAASYALAYEEYRRV